MTLQDTKDLIMKWFFRALIACLFIVVVSNFHTWSFNNGVKAGRDSMFHELEQCKEEEFNEGVRFSYRDAHEQVYGHYLYEKYNGSLDEADFFCNWKYSEAWFEKSKEEIIKEKFVSYMEKTDEAINKFADNTTFRYYDNFSRI